jgi:dipeptidase E
MKFGKASMKLLLTSAGIKNPSIHAALLRLLGKPIAESDALLVPTAVYGHPSGTPGGAWRFVTGRSGCPMGELGWKSLGLLELTALPSLGRERWLPWIEQADVLLVDGGDALYLAHWMRASGLAELLPSLRDKVWVGLSAGSMVMAPQVGAEFIEMKPPLAGGDVALGVVDFAIFPHLDYPGFAENTMACAEQWATGLGCPGYAIDDQTAIQVVDGRAEVVSEGQWRYFAR